MYLCVCVGEETKAATNCTAAFLNGYVLEESDWRLWPWAFVRIWGYVSVYVGSSLSLTISLWPLGCWTWINCRSVLPKRSRRASKCPEQTNSMSHLASIYWMFLKTNLRIRFFAHSMCWNRFWQKQSPRFLCLKGSRIFYLYVFAAIAICLLVLVLPKCVVKKDGNPLIFISLHWILD